MKKIDFINISLYVSKDKNVLRFSMSKYSHKKGSWGNNYHPNQKQKRPKPNDKLYKLIGQVADEGLLDGLLNNESVNFVGKKTVLMKSIEEKYSIGFLYKIYSLMTKKNLRFIDSETKFSHIDYCIREMKELNVYDSQYGNYHKFVDTLLNDRVEFHMNLLIELYTQKGTHVYNLFKDHPRLEMKFHNEVKNSINKSNYKEIFANLKELNFIFDDIVDFIIKGINKDIKDEIKILTEIMEIDLILGIKYIIDNDLMEYFQELRFNDVIIGDILKKIKEMTNKQLDFILNRSSNKTNTIHGILIDKEISMDYHKYFLKFLDENEINEFIELYEYLDENTNLIQVVGKIIMEWDKIPYNLFLKMVHCNNYIHSDQKKVASKKVINITSNDILHFMNGYGSDYIDLDSWILQIIKDKKFSQMEVLEILKYRLSKEVTLQLLDTIDNNLKNNPDYQNALTRAANRIIESHILNNKLRKKIIEKLLTFYSYVKSNLRLKIDEVKEIYFSDNQTSINEIRVTFNDLFNWRSIKKLEIVKYLIKDHIDKLEPDQIKYIVYYWEYDFDFVCDVILDNFNIEDYVNWNLGEITCLEWIINLQFNDLKKKKDYVIKFIEKSKDLLIHKNINLQKLLELDLPIEIINKLAINLSQESIFDSFYLKINDSHHIIIDACKPMENILKTSNEYFKYFWKIRYAGQEGEDAGGLIRDFYYVLGKEFKKIMELKDDYYYINQDSKDNVKLWYTIGKMFGKMFAIEKYSCGINLHPYILYRITRPGHNKNTTLNEKYLKDVDTIKGILKINEMNEDEWKIFTESIGITDITYDQREVYSQNEIFDIYEKEYQPGLSNFMDGFWEIVKMNQIKYFQPDFVIQKICGNIKYIISEDGNEYSIENRLCVCFGNNDYKTAFINALKVIQEKDNDKLQKLFRFWTGTPFIDLKKNKLHIDSYTSKKNVFEAHTCSNQLVTPHYDHIAKNKLSDEIIIMIENTIRNQDMADEGNLHTQYY